MSRPLLEVRDVAVLFGRVRALNGLSFDVEEGEIVGLIGANGAGKSTLVNVLSGTIASLSGSVAFDGQVIDRWAPHRIAALGLARTFQLAQPFSGLNALECVTLGALFGASAGRRYGVASARRLARETLDLVGLAEHAETAAQSLNVAQRKKLEIARALATRPRLLLLDEVMAGLSGGEIDRGIDLVHTIRARGVTIVVIEHVMQAVARLSDRVIGLDRGEKIAEGLFEAVVSNPRMLRAYFGDRRVP